MTRTFIASFGLKGYRLANVYRLADGRALVERWVRGRPKRKTFPDVKAAKAFAKRYYELGAEPHRTAVTLRELFDRYIDTVSDQRRWRPKTLLLRQQERRTIEAVLTPDLDVVTLTPAHLDALWSTLRKRGMAESQVQRRCQFLKQVAMWGHSRDLIPHAKLAAWRSPQVATPEVGEHTPEEVDRILGWLRREPRGQRAHSALLLASSHGIRANALLHLRWEDVDWSGPTLTMQEAHDKTRRTWSRPLTDEGLAALLTMQDYQRARGIDTPWIFHGARDPQRPYTYGALWLQLRAAEAGSGVTHQNRRAAHGLRRHAVNMARQVTGDAALGLAWVGDRDVSQAVSYIRTREDELGQIADAQHEPSRNRISGAGRPERRGAVVGTIDPATTYGDGDKPAMGLEPMTPSLGAGELGPQAMGSQGVKVTKLDQRTPENAENPSSNRTGTVFRISVGQPGIPPAGVISGSQHPASEGGAA